MTFVLTVMFAALSLVLHARRLPPQNLAAIALLIFGAGAIVEWSSLTFRVPFTPLPLDKTTFWSLPLGWIGILMVSRAVAQLLFGSHRQSATYGLWVLVTTSLVSTALWSLVEATAAVFVPINALGRLVTSVAILLLIFPWLIEKRPGIIRNPQQ